MGNCEIWAFSKSLRITERVWCIQEQRVFGINVPAETGSATKFRSKSKPFLAHCVWFRDLGKGAYSSPFSGAKL